MTARRAPSRFEDLPLVMTLEHVREVLGVGRSTVYAEARRYLATEGREGLPCVRLGRLLRVPRGLLATYLGESLEEEKSPAGRRGPELHGGFSNAHSSTAS